METSAVCAIALHEDAYIDEWVSYHLDVAGFDHVYVYDNDEAAPLRDLASRHPAGRVTVVPFPGRVRQMAAYQDCLARARGRHAWCAFLDVDEFLVLRRHACVNDLLRELCPSGALCLNWVMFGSNGHERGGPEPVLERFTRRAAGVDPHVKSIVRVADAVSMSHPHVAVLREGAVQRDTAGRTFEGPWNPEGPEDVAVVHHYFVKSREEFAAKVARGRADVPHGRSLVEFDAFDLNEVEDRRAVYASAARRAA